MDPDAYRRPSSWILLRSIWQLHRKHGEKKRQAGFRFEEIYAEVLHLAAPPPDFRVAATYLRILEGRGLVLTREKGHVVRYRPAIDERTAVAAEIDLFLDEVIHGDPVLLGDLLEKAAERRGGSGAGAN